MNLLTGLTSLDLSGNSSSLSSGGLRQLTALTGVRDLSVAGRMITTPFGFIDVFTHAFPSLTSLDVSACECASLLHLSNTQAGVSAGQCAHCCLLQAADAPQLLQPSVICHTAKGKPDEPFGGAGRPGCPASIERPGAPELRIFRRSAGPSVRRVFSAVLCTCRAVAHVMIDFAPSHGGISVILLCYMQA